MRVTEEEIYRKRISGVLKEYKFGPKVIDLFAGAGGMSLGFSPFLGHNFEVVWANDFNEYAANTYNMNFGKHCNVGDIVDILEDPKTKVPKADLVIGGPPCQGFSLLNKFKDGDPRKQLWRPFMEVVKRSGASVFVMENVPELLSSFECGEIYGVAQSMGFKLASAKLCAADYGVAQLRWRAFIVGCKFADPSEVFPPKRTHIAPENGVRRRFLEKDVPYIDDAKPYKTVRDAIADLPQPKGTEIRKEKAPLDLHFGRMPTAKSLKRYMAIPKEGMNRFDLQRLAPELTPDCWIRKKTGGTDLFGRLWWDKPSVTIRTEFYKPEKGRYLHPEQHRPITHREAARIQSFPDKFVFTGSKVEIARQIGNAVPCELAARVADSVFALLLSKRDIECQTSSRKKDVAPSCLESREATQSRK
ncbi:DNA cytosine methyltransferase [Geomonas silvestris]|nr:DNA cytosine methyltransferase [Geomonas silvestris]